ncbi:hypothetical protein NLG97_g3669 [Lecanicillium saksenae]|uniref:Uncharacterized protein n=1 Tax=Lecanicillium saksenae TaxID=468837 RepID=A0ACC1R0P5_9HYPO|nr:hypothetical protein NLG97_g3669 [Lecanicillium saksenae]
MQCLEASTSGGCGQASCSIPAHLYFISGMPNNGDCLSEARAGTCGTTLGGQAKGDNFDLNFTCNKHDKKRFHVELNAGGMIIEDVGHTRCHAALTSKEQSSLGCRLHPPAMSTVVVKLGGAAITDKSTPDTLSVNLDSLIESVAQAYQQILRPSGHSLILIHGAGSFGHPPAKKYQVKAGWKTGTGDAEGDVSESRDNVKFGMALTRQRVIQLHLHIIQRLHERGQMPVLSVSTYDTVDTNNGAVTQESSARLVARVQQVLDEGFVPLLFGDAVFDHALGSTILSGDALMYHLAQRLSAVRRCVFVTDVAGIFTQDPKQAPDAALIKRICCSDSNHSNSLDKDNSVASVDDVTGAMASKWQWAKRIVTDAKQLQEVVICQASDSSNAISLGVNASIEGHSGNGNWTTIIR